MIQSCQIKSKRNWYCKESELRDVLDNIDTYKIIISIT